MSFEQKVRFHAFLMGLIAAIGLAAFFASFYIRAEFASGYFAGTGAGLFFAGIVLGIRKIRLLSHPERLKKVKIEEEDERNLLLSFRASHYTFLILIFFGYFVSIIAAFYSREILEALSAVICSAVLCRTILYFAMRNRS